MVEIDVSHHGIFQLHLNNGQKEWFTGISVHVLGADYNPTVFDARDYDSGPLTGPVQKAIDEWESIASSADVTSLTGAIILVYPNDGIAEDNPTGAHVENLIMTYPGAKIQGIGTFFESWLRFLSHCEYDVCIKLITDISGLFRRNRTWS